MMKPVASPETPHRPAAMGLWGGVKIREIMYIFLQSEWQGLTLKTVLVFFPLPKYPDESL